MAGVVASPLTEALIAALQTDAIQAAALGGVWEDVPQTPAYPFVLVEVAPEVDVRGFGTGGMPQVDILTHVYSKTGSRREAQQLAALVVSALKDASLTVTGYQQAGRVVYRETVPIQDEELLGEKVHELVSRFTYWGEEV